MKYKFLIMLLLQGLAGAMSAQLPATLIQWRGNVFDMNNSPLDSVYIVLRDSGNQQYTVYTNAAGYFEFTQLPAGAYHCTMSKPNYTSYSANMGLSATVAPVVIRLQPLVVPSTIAEEDAKQDALKLETKDLEKRVSRSVADLKTKKTPPPPSPKKAPLTQRSKEKAPVNPVSEQHGDIEEYGKKIENEYIATSKENLSTFSIDVDRASYSNVRRFLVQSKQRPPRDAVRVEEMINYFDYNYPQPTDNHPFDIHLELSDCPWNPKSKLLMIGLQGKRIDLEKAPANNLVFLIDVSGSMDAPNKLGLVKASLKMLTQNLRNIDKIAIVVYAGAAGLVLPATNGTNKPLIYNMIDMLNAGGSTAGGAGIELAYKVAEENFVAGGNNRVILCSDGDFNVGISSPDELEKLITEKRKTGIFLTVLGYGQNNYKDVRMETLADKGNGNYAYIDNMTEARKTLVQEMGGTLHTIAKDVKLQLDFNKKFVQSYRLVGYENRLLANKDFDDDTKDAGEMGAGHTVTAFYEIALHDGVDVNASLLTVRTRYKQPTTNKSLLFEKIMPTQSYHPLAQASENFRLAASIAGFGMLLGQSKHTHNYTLQNAIDLALTAVANDPNGYRAELIQLMQTAQTLR